MWPWQELATILILKIVATSATSGSHAVRGVFTPTLFVGSSVGFLFGAFIQAVSSLPGIQPSALLSPRGFP